MVRNYCPCNRNESIMPSKTLMQKLRRLLFPHYKKKPPKLNSDPPLSTTTNNNCTGTHCPGIDVVFRYLDGDGDGKIHPSDLQRSVAAMSTPLALTDGEAELVVALMDTNGDGVADLDGFARLVDEYEREEERLRDLREAFDVYVLEGGGGGGGEKGGITPDSLKKVLRRLGVVKNTTECEDMIRVFDLNRDGVVNFDEFLVMMAPWTHL